MDGTFFIFYVIAVILLMYTYVCVNVGHVSEMPGKGTIPPRAEFTYGWEPPGMDVGNQNLGALKSSKHSQPLGYLSSPLY